MEWIQEKENGQNKNDTDGISILADNCKVYFPDHIWSPHHRVFYHRRTPSREGILKLRNAQCTIPQLALNTKMQVKGL